MGGPIQYDDRVPVTALVLAGRYPQKHMNNRPGRELCVWDRKAGKAYVSEADQLLKPALVSSFAARCPAGTARSA